MNRRGEDNRRFASTLPFTDQCCRFEPVQVGHLDIEQDERALLRRNLCAFRKWPCDSLHQHAAELGSRLVAGQPSFAS